MLAAVSQPADTLRVSVPTPSSELAERSTWCRRLQRATQRRDDSDNCPEAGRFV
jgi:hypothetical protein